MESAMRKIDKIGQTQTMLQLLREMFLSKNKVVTAKCEVSQVASNVPSLVRGSIGKHLFRPVSTRYSRDLEEGGGCKQTEVL